MTNRIFRALKKDSVLELLMYDVVGQDWFGDGLTAASVAAEIKAAGEFTSFAVRINSPGGDVFEGVAIANLLRAQNKPVAVMVDGVAASAASVIAMAGDSIAMGQGSMIMIHNASTMAYGQASEFRKTADTLDKISDSIAATYVTRTGKPLAEIRALMDAETWLSAEDSVREGFATEVVSRSDEERRQSLALASSFTRQFRNAPAFEAAPAEAAEEIPSEAGTDPDWEGLLAVYRRQLDLEGTR